MIVGVLSTQIYLQAIFAAKDVRQARNGAFLSAAVYRPSAFWGSPSVSRCAPTPGSVANPAQALPYFLEISFPPVVAALFAAGLLLIVLGTAPDWFSG